MKRVYMGWIAGVCWLCAGCSGGCRDKSASNGSSDGSVVDVMVDVNDASGPDVQVDASKDGGKPDGVQYDYCDQVVFRLPPKPADKLYSKNILFNKVVTTRWVDYPTTESRVDVYLFDLNECKEYLVSAAPGVQILGSILGNEIVWNDSRYQYINGSNEGIELFLFDINTWTERRLTNDSSNKAYPQYNGLYIAYWDSTGAPSGDFALTLWDLDTDQHTELATWQQASEFHAISERYVSWTAYSFEPGAVGKDLFYYELETGITNRVESTFEVDVRIMDLWDDRIIWMEDDEGQFNILTYTIGTGVEERLTADGFDHRAPRLRRNLATWLTWKYSGGNYWNNTPYRDLYLYDVETKVGRRVTTESTSWIPGHADPPWVLFWKDLGDTNAEVYVMNLLQAGLIDPSGHVVPE